MKEFFMKKSVVMKIIIVAVFIILFNFSSPTISYGKSFVESAGGILIESITPLVVTVADTVLNTLQTNFFAVGDVVVAARSSTYTDVSWAAIGLTIVGAIVCVVGALTVVGAVVEVAAAVSAAGIAAGVSALAGSSIGGGIIMAGVGAGVAHFEGSRTIEGFDGAFDLPTIVYTPAAIFANQVPALDINFINPAEDIEVPVTVKPRSEVGNNPLVREANDKDEQIVAKIQEFKDVYEQPKDSRWVWYEDRKVCEKLYELASTVDTLYPNMTTSPNIDFDFIQNCNKYIEYITVSKNDGWTEGSGTNNLDIRLTTANNPAVEIMNYVRDFTPPIFEETETTTEIRTFKSSSRILQGIISSWYSTLRNIAFAGLLVILIYIGIRVLLSSTANEKAKYKNMIQDWLVAMCLLFVMHYIMAFILEIGEQLTNLMVNNNTDTIIIDIPEDTTVTGADGNPQTISPNTWATNFVGYVRYMTQKGATVDQNGKDLNTDYLLIQLGYVIMYVVLVIFTVVFTVMYLKRVIYMAFLTLIAPLVAMTYPLDKINDGKAQAFDIWLKEYIFNALLQPMHFLIYVIIIGSAMELAWDYPVYAVVALGFMIPAEKLVRKLLGFEKAGTVGAFGGAAGAALLMGGMNRLLHKPPHIEKEKEKEDDPNKIKMSGGVDKFAGIAGGPGSDDGQGGPLPNPTDPVRMAGGPGGSNPPGGGGPGDGNGGNQTPPADAVYSQLIGEYGMSPREAVAFLNGGNPSGLNPGDSNNGGPAGGQGDPGQGDPGGEPPAPPIGNRQNPLINNNNNGGQNNRQRRTIRGIGRGVWQGMSSVHNRNMRRMTRSLRKAKPLRTLRRVATSALGAAALGTVGLAAGVASGDLGKAAQYTAAGAALGGSFAKGLGDSAANILDLEGAGKAFQRGYYGDDYKERVLKPQKMQNFKLDEANHQYFREQGLDAAQIKEIMNNRLGDYIDNDIDNAEDVAATYKLEQEYQRQNMDQQTAQAKAVSAAKFVNKYGTKFATSEKERKDLRATLTKDYEDAGYTNQGPRLADETMKNMMEFLAQKP